jgi:hypothetical protein
LLNYKKFLKGKHTFQILFKKKNFFSNHSKNHLKFVISFTILLILPVKISESAQSKMSEHRRYLMPIISVYNLLSFVKKPIAFRSQRLLLSCGYYQHFSFSQNYHHMRWLPQYLQKKKFSTISKIIQIS